MNSKPSAKYQTDLFALPGGFMNCVAQQEKWFRRFVLFLAAMVVLTLAVAVIPAAAQTYKVVYSFGTNNGSSDALNPGLGPGFIAQGRDGNLYSTAEGGGTATIGGAAFKITPSGKETVLASFSIAAGNGYIPLGGLTLGTDGNFYGTTQQGGATNCNFGYGCGTFFKLTPAGVLTTLFIFPGDYSEGSYPYAAAIQGTDGNFYGTTTAGGALLR
jgi:uncharacterized repeat protein (TIGR03803 family)